VSNTILGIDIGNYSIKMVEAQPSGGKMQVTNYDIAKLPENVINDGKLTDIQSITEIVQDMISRKLRKQYSSGLTLA
jgi:Tfp pilus assembly PilM family ATPase